MNNFMKRFILVAAAFMAALPVYAQISISGFVKDAKGEPVFGATVFTSGDKPVGTMTNSDGSYSIVIPASEKNPTLVASCLGYKDQKQDVNGKLKINFVLEDASTELDEVVVVGYGAMRKSDLTGSVSSVRIDEADAAQMSTLDQLIQGHAAGVQVVNNGGAPDGGVSIRVRGMSSFNSSNEPLYVIDGILINTTQEVGSLLSKGSDNGDSDEAVNGLMGLNPNDIESIEILKDASATAIYGALGANGVVLIQTKTAKGDKPVVRFSAGFDLSSPSKHLDVLSFDEYVSYLRDIAAVRPSDSALYLKKIFEDPSDPASALKVRPVDWQDECMRTAISQRYHFSIAGKGKNLTYALALGFSDKKGIVKGTGVKQYTARLNFEKKIGRKFTFGSKTNLSYVDSDMTQSTGGGRLSAATSLTRALSTYRPYSSSDDLSEEAVLADDELKSSPDKWLDRTNFMNYRKEFRITPSIFAEYKFLPWLSVRSTLGGDYRNSERQKFKSAFINTTSSGSSGAIGTSELFNWNWDTFAQMHGKWGGHSLNGTVGTSLYSSFTGVQKIQGWNIDQFKSGIESIVYAPNRSLGYQENANQTLSFFARGIYSFKDRYVVTATYRVDGSSRFSGANKWAGFPSFALAWRLSQEPWFNVKAISAAKIRFGWGRVGNQNVSNYQTGHTFVTSHISSHDPGNDAESTITVTPSNFANPDLKWETTEQLNAGLDLSFWNGRLALAADFYNKTTFDLLQAKLIPNSSGFSAYYANEGTILNRGFEITVDAVPVKKGGFEWTLGANFSMNKNKILQISESASRKNIWVTPDKQENVVYFEGAQAGNSAFCAQPANIFMEGYAMGLFYGYKVKGIVGEGETGIAMSNDGAPRGEGCIDYYDLNQNGYLDEDDRTVIGDPNPDFTYGFKTSFKYKRLSLTLDFNGSYGNDIFNLNAACDYATDLVNRNHSKASYLNAWSPTNPNSKLAGLGKTESADYKRFSDYFLEDGSYLRLSRIALQYSIPRKKAKVVKGITLGLACGNVFVWTKYTGWDPDVNSFGQNTQKMGVDSGSYPGSRTASFDVKLTF